MTSSTFSTIAVPADAQAAAQADMPGFFTAPYSADGREPATHYVSSGYFLDSELDFIVNDATWKKKVKFGDASQALADLGLQPVVPVETQEPEIS